MPNFISLQLAVVKLRHVLLINFLCNITEIMEGQRPLVTFCIYTSKGLQKHRKW